MNAGLRIQQGGAGDRVLLLLHGLGATGDVWNRWPPLLAQRWPGRWIAPDLPGHGGSAAALPAYTFQTMAAAVAPLVGPAERVSIVGHSLGGVVGLALAGGYGLRVETVVGLGIKVEWSAEELQKAAALADRSPAWFATREEAAARYLRISGLAGLVEPHDPAVTPGLLVRDGRWGLAMDPRSFGVGAPDMTGLLASTTAAVTLARGEHDPMNTEAQYRALGAATVTLPGLGHNAHVENPDAVLTLLDG